VDLPEIDVVALQSPQRSIKIAKQGASRRVDDALAIPNYEPGLRSDDDFVPVPKFADQFADNALGITGAVRGSRVDQGATGVAKHLKQGMSVLSRRVAAPGHGAQPEPRHTQPAAPDLPSIHGETLTA